MIRAYAGVAMMLLAGAGGHEPSSGDFASSGKATWEHGDFLAAAESYERAVELAPDSPEPAYNMALSYYRLGLSDQTVRYLDKAQAVAKGQFIGRCLLLRADLEYRQAMTEKPARQVEGLERALRLYRDSLAASGEAAAWSGIVKYDIEVVKLRLPVARSRAPRVASPPGTQDVSAGEAAESGAPSRNRGSSRQEEKDW